jgi:hypothetical protein
MPPENWRAYGDRGRKQAEHWYAGSTYSFGELAELRAGDHFEKECTDEKFETRYQACQQAIVHMSKTLADAKPDVCIILGDDQHEAFNDGNMPSIAIYHGDTVIDAPRAAGAFAVRDPKIDESPTEPMHRPTDAGLGEYLIEALTAAEFDIARTNEFSPEHNNGAIGHAFYYIYRRLMHNDVIANVPLLVNTYYPPNSPTANRCYKLGQALREAIMAWDTDKKVAIFASGGLSHTVIEEELDEKIIEGLKTNDVSLLTDYPDVRFRGGTSEIKNWIALAGAMAGNHLRMDLIDYIPCYRTEAGNGCAMGFAEWT